MFKQFIALLIILTSIQHSFGQVIKIQAGPSVSNLVWSIKEIERTGKDKVFVGKSVFIGKDYLQSRLFNLSTSIGYLQKGDISEITYTNDEGEATELPEMKAVFNYISVNTTAEFKFPILQTCIPYVSLGPRVDYLHSYTKDFSFLEEMDELPTYTYGLNLGGGLKIDLPRLQVGIRSDYYLNLAKMAEWVSNSDDQKAWIYDETYLINLTVGYKLR